MPDILTSIHGKKLGLDNSGNLVQDGDSVFASNGSSTKAPRIASGAVATAPTTAAGLAAYGVHWLSSAQGTYLLADPVPGQSVKIMTAVGTTAAGRIVKVSTGSVTIGSSGGFNQWQSSAAHSLELVGITTALYGVVSNAAASSLSTSLGALSTI